MSVPVHGPVVYSIAVACPLCLGVFKVVNLHERLVRVGYMVGSTAYQFDVFNQVSSNVSYNIAKIILDKWVCTFLSRRQPETHIVNHWWILRVWLERTDAARLKLGNETLIGCPEESNVGNLKENHGYPFKSKSKSPSYFAFDTC